MALRVRMESGISDTWIEDLAREALVHTTAELVAFEQAMGQPCTLQEAALFLTTELNQ